MTISISAVAALAVIEVAAICHGMNGQFMALSVGGITLVVGYCWGRGAPGKVK